MGRLKKLIQLFLRNPSEVRFDDVRLPLEAFGFGEQRSKGSHHIFRSPTGLQITVPKKHGHKVKAAYVRQIIQLLQLREWNDENSD